ncbi:MAG: hypothetical protein KZQ73_02025, partial [Candidatus Thiodiazotropha sp. (ex Semelilucina semeliformis)]|nr:hypothetical protein [Candidatus Thiodiazotropha sp. (ex Semelilucina semeliformis)]
MFPDRVDQRLAWGRQLSALLFLLGILFSSQFFFPGIGDHSVLLIAAVLGGYMALNIGANDA